MAAWRRLRSGQDKAAGWCWFVIALAASLGANVSTAGLLDLHAVPAWLRVLVAGWPALAFLGGTLLAHGAHETTRSTNTDVVAEHNEPAHYGPEESPKPSVAEPEPASPALPTPSGPAVPAALVAHARKVADAHQARTGTPIDTDTLRTRLGVPAPLAAQIAAHLT